MLKQTSKSFRKNFLLEFTKEIIRSTEAYRSIRIKKEVKLVLHEKPTHPQFVPPTKNIREIVKEKKQRDSKTISNLKKEDPFTEFFKHRRFPTKRATPHLLRIPETVLPETVRYLRPVVTSKQLDLGKLNQIIKDPLVRIIECNGPNEKIIVIGTMGRKNTKIILSKEEINSIIQKFSETSKIPVNEGIFKVVAGRLILSAIVSEVIGSKFIIKKMPGPSGSFRV